MDVVSLIGVALTWILTELFKKNAALRGHVPLIVTILAMVIGAIQAALQATTASAQVDTMMVILEPANPAEVWIRNVLVNVSGSVLVQNGIKKWLVDYVFGRLLRKVFA